MLLQLLEGVEPELSASERRSSVYVTDSMPLKESVLNKKGEPDPIQVWLHKAREVVGNGAFNGFSLKDYAELRGKSLWGTGKRDFKGLLWPLMFSCFECVCVTSQGSCARSRSSVC